MKRLSGKLVSETGRRDLLGGLLVSLATPAVIRIPGLVMPVRPVSIYGVGLSPQALWVLPTWNLAPDEVRQVRDRLYMKGAAYWKMANAVSKKYMQARLQGNFLSRIDGFEVYLES